MAFSNLNVSPVISPDILKNISTSTAITSFGTQLKDKAKEQITIGNVGNVLDLNTRKDELILRLKELGNQQVIALEKATKDLQNNQITKEEYDKIVESINVSIKSAKEAVELEINKLTQDIENTINNVYDKLKKVDDNFKKEIKNLKKKIQDTKNKARKNLSKQVVLNTAKTLAPIISLQLSNQFSSVLSQRKKLEDLVNQVNNYITTQITNEQTVIVATNLRNNAITLINNNIRKLENLQNILKKITLTITIFSTIINILSAIPIPTSVPPGIGIPVSLIIRLTKTIERANRLISALSTLLAAATILLENEILILNELRDRLKEISLRLDGQTPNTLSNIFLPVGDQFPPYKGFNFKIKEEQDPRFVVRGNKRRYAVAIDRDGVEVLKSEYSFTLDPNDLIEQLKLVIDQRNLQG